MNESLVRKLQNISVIRNVSSQNHCVNIFEFLFIFRMISSFIVLCIYIVISFCTELNILSKTQTSVLEKYESYSDVLLVHLKIPEDTLFASFKFMAEETEKLSVIKFGKSKICLFSNCHKDMFQVVNLATFHYT